MDIVKETRNAPATALRVQLYLKAQAQRHALLKALQAVIARQLEQGFARRSFAMTGGYAAAISL